jgi:single-strand DNA-binding protein
VKDQQSGEWADQDVTFWDVVAFGQLGENVAESLAKGSAVLVTCRAAQEEWTTKEGEKRRSMKVVADEVAPSLRWVTCKIGKTDRSRPAAGSGNGGQAEADPCAVDAPGSYSGEPPFWHGEPGVRIRKWAYDDSPGIYPRPLHIIGQTIVPLADGVRTGHWTIHTLRILMGIGDRQLRSWRARARRCLQAKNGLRSPPRYTTRPAWQPRP